MPQPKDTDWLNGYKNKTHCCQQETHFRPRDTYRLQVKGQKEIFHVNGNQKKAGVTILISDKIHFKIKRKTYNQDYSIQQGSHSDSTEKSKAFQTSKS